MSDATLSNAIPGISSYPMTITFGPIAGTQTATLAVSDTTNGGTGTASVRVGVAVSQTITFTAPATTTSTYAPGLTIQIAATSTGASNSTTNLMQFSIVQASSTGIGTLSAPVLSNGTWSATLTVTQAGTFTINGSQSGGLVNNVYYESTTQPLNLTVNKAADIITFTPPKSPLAYTPTLTATLSATGSGSTSPIVFSVDGSSTGAGTISGNTLTITQAGTIVLDANQAADPNYLQAAQVQEVLVVNPASQTITVTPVTVPFHYIATCSTVTLCSTLSIQATGGATDNPIALSPDATNGVEFAILGTTTKGAVTTTTISLLANQNLSFPANLVLDANENGNSNYSSATQVKITISVLAALPLQSITWTNPGTEVTGVPVTLAAAASSTLAVSYTSATTSVCTVNNATAAATFLAAGTCTITASQPGDNLTYAAAVPVTNTFYVNAANTTPGIGTQPLAFVRYAAKRDGWALAVDGERAQQLPGLHRILLQRIALGRHLLLQPQPTGLYAGSEYRLAAGHLIHREPDRQRRRHGLQ